MTKAAALNDLDDVADDATEFVEDAQDAIVTMIQDQPVTSVIVALIVGVIVGKLIL